MINVILEISPAESAALQTATIVFRKFFHMIFVGLDGKSLNTYTAIVFSVRPKELEFLEFNDYFSTISRQTAELFDVQLKYDGVKSVKMTDLTDSFISQAETLKQIWEDCYNISKNNVAHFVNKGCLNDELQKFLCIKNEKLSAEEQKIATKSEFKKLDEPNRCILSAHLGNEIEYISWVKSEIQLEESIPENKVFFEVKFAFNKEKWRVYCPDYTWYICTPKVFSNEPNKMLVKLADNKVHRNMMQPLNDQSALRLKEWLWQENINKCHRCRLLYNEQKNPQMTLKSSVVIELFIEYAYDRHGNKQFFEGLLVAFLIGSVADWTKLVEILDIAGISSEKLVYFCSFLFPLTIVVNFLVLIVPLSILEQRVYSRCKKNMLKLLKFGTIIAGVLGLLFFFGVIPVSSMILQNSISIMWPYVACGLCLLSVLLSVVYFFVIKKYSGVSIYTYL